MSSLLKKTTVLLISLLLLTAASVSEAKWRLDEDPELAEPRNFRMASDGWRVTPVGQRPVHRRRVCFAVCHAFRRCRPRRPYL